MFFPGFLFALILLSYILLILAFLYAWKKLPSFEPNSVQKESLKKQCTIRISVIVAVRNEENNIENILQDLIQQSYPSSYFEIIFVNDHSTDQTVKLIENHIPENKNISLIHLDYNLSGKKDAISTGIKYAKGELILTSDADCRIDENHLITLAGFYEKYKPEMIIAPVVIKSGDTIFEKFQSLEFLSLIASTAGAVALNRPVMCNGANLAYRRETFLKHSDALNRKFASGDDVLFMLKIKKDKKKNRQERKSIYFLKSNKATVSTKAQTNIKNFVQQRKRWTSKSSAYHDFDIILTAIIVFLINLSLLISFFGMFFNKLFLASFLIIFISKSLIDFIFLLSINSFFKTKGTEKPILQLFPLMQFVYFFYVCFIAIIGNIGNYSWKGRKLK
jgi:cellulose synthase/poly-beta-1,6-N-acetylglucosamine synthase-like glycosyltransferase